MLGRWGGEEFIVLLPETSLELAWASAERIRLAVESQLHQLGAGTEVPLTISIGISASLGPQDTVERMVRRADTALYLAKKQGRNCSRKALPDSPDRQYASGLRNTYQAWRFWLNSRPRRHVHCPAGQRNPAARQRRHMPVTPPAQPRWPAATRRSRQIPPRSAPGSPWPPRRAPPATPVPGTALRQFRQSLPDPGNDFVQRFAARWRLGPAPGDVACPQRRVTLLASCWVSPSNTPTWRSRKAGTSVTGNPSSSATRAALCRARSKGSSAAAETEPAPRPAPLPAL